MTEPVIKTMPNTDKYRDNFDKIFNKDKPKTINMASNSPEDLAYWRSLKQGYDGMRETNNA